MFPKTLPYLIFFLFFLKLSAEAQHISTPQHERVASIVQAFLKQANLPGLSMAVSHQGEVIYAKGFGYADLKTKRPMNVNTRLRTASVAKVITATAIGRLVSEGKLDLDAPIKTYIPYIDAQYAELTTRQLAGHTSGLQHRPTGKGYEKKSYTNTRQTVEIITSPLLFEPDTKYQYSTNGYNLLAAVIEGASGKTYTNYLSEQIFQPLGMISTMPENIEKLTEEDANLYYLKKGKLLEEKLTSGSYKLAGAGFRSTPTDLVQMMDAYTNGFISSETVTKMFTSHQLKNGEKTQVGITWRPSFDAFGNPVIEHAGSWKGTRTVVVHYPKENLNIAIMINADCSVLIEETAHLLAQFFRKKRNTTFVTATINKQLKAVFQLSEEPKTYEGQLVLEAGIGKLMTTRKDFLHDAPLYSLGQEHQYIVVTKYGLLYLVLQDENTAKGELYLYYNRNTKSPTTTKPSVILQ